jgi:hypothetical protein
LIWYRTGYHVDVHFVAFLHFLRFFSIPFWFVFFFYSFIFWLLLLFLDFCCTIQFYKNVSAVFSHNNKRKTVFSFYAFIFFCTTFFSCPSPCLFGCLPAYSAYLPN